MLQMQNCIRYCLFVGALASAVLLHIGPAQAATESVVHSFGGPPDDGWDPRASLIDVGGTLYGTTAGGGAKGGGIVFKVNPDIGAETVLYSFCSQTNCTDGQWPMASLIDVGGTLYGTTESGGANCANYCGGTVFSLNPKTGAETVVYSFCSQAKCTDGHNPYPSASLTDVGGTLYGTTWSGGANCGKNGGCGTVFAVNPETGAETVVYSFCSQTNCADGSFPSGRLIDVGGTLYGTTEYGGVNCQVGCGTVFKLDPNTGAETVVHTFGRYGRDGVGPTTGVIEVSGILYGTTQLGGAHCHKKNEEGCGTVFRVNLQTGAESVVHSFCSIGKCTDGGGPYAGLIDVGGTLYGTTAVGGAKGDCRHGCGTVFSVNPKTGAETVVYSFICTQGNCTDAENPSASLIDVGGTLYGTTAEGGTKGYGTVFKVTLP